MSIQWLDKLLFGGDPTDPLPTELKSLILRMEADGIPWSNIILQGGFTAFPYQVHGDLNMLIDHLEEAWLERQPSHFKTRAVSKFWDQLQLLLARRVVDPPALPAPTQGDEEILQKMLYEQQQTNFKYESADFWGEVARRFINIRRAEEPSPLPDTSFENFKRAMQLYDITCKARGQYFDPLNMHLVPNSEYVNAVHWQTDQNLEAFLHDTPTHPLAVSVQGLIQKSIKKLIHGQKPAFIQCPQIDALVHNVNVIHESVEKVPNEPPKLIDVLQRLLALCHRDELWEKDVPPSKPVVNLGLSLLQLTAQLRITEREKRILWKHAVEKTTESVS